MKAKLFITILSFVLCLAASARASNTLKSKYESEHKKVDKIYKEIQERKKEVSQLTKKEREILSVLGDVENRIDRQNARLEDLTRTLKQKKIDLAQTEDSLKKAQSEVQALKEKARNRVVSYYKFGPVGLMNVILGSYSMPDLFIRQEALHYMLRRDAAIMAAFQSKIDNLSHAKQQVLESTQALQQLKEEIQIETRHLEKLRQERADLLAAVCQEKKECLRDIRELQQAAESLNATIRDLQRKLEETGRQQPLARGFAAQKGKLQPPVKGKLVGLFGRVRRTKSGATIIRNGIDIQSPTGTEIRSIYTGRVIYIGNLRGYGNIMILDHGDKYYSLYAHASKFFKEVGSMVSKGEPIGLVGGVGSLLGECLYFEIRHGGKSENPLSWIDVAKLKFDS